MTKILFSAPRAFPTWQPIMVLHTQLNPLIHWQSPKLSLDSHPQH